MLENINSQIEGYSQKFRRLTKIWCQIRSNFNFPNCWEQYFLPDLLSASASKASMLFHQISELFIKFELTSMKFKHKWTFSVRANIVGITIERSCTKDLGFSNNKNIWKHHKMYIGWQGGMIVNTESKGGWCLQQQNFSTNLPAENLWL